MKKKKTKTVFLVKMTEGGAQWKSRFPVARIKKIMQADEDVGKVAQVTPVAICISRFTFNGANCSKSLGVVYG